jgi:hypothetical protein
MEALVGEQGTTPPEVFRRDILAAQHGRIQHAVDRYVAVGLCDSRGGRSEPEDNARSALRPESVASRSPYLLIALIAASSYSLKQLRTFLSGE